MGEKRRGIVLLHVPYLGQSQYELLKYRVPCRITVDISDWFGEDLVCRNAGLKYERPLYRSFISFRFNGTARGGRKLQANTSAGPRAPPLGEPNKGFWHIFCVIKWRQRVRPGTFYSLPRVPQPLAKRLFCYHRGNIQNDEKAQQLQNILKIQDTIWKAIIPEHLYLQAVGSPMKYLPVTTSLFR